MTDSAQDTLPSLLDRLEGTLRYLADSGVSGVDCRPETLEKIRSWGEKKTPVQGAPGTPPPAEPRARGPESLPEKRRGAGGRGSAAEDRKETHGGGPLEAVRSELGECTRCRLSGSRRNIVFGEGNPRARLVFVGEGPGRDEDMKGRPFVGAAGRLLTRIIEAMGLSREEVYIANIVKCRPPNNRNPQPDEIETCFPFLCRQIEAIGPEVICALGSFAARTLLGTEAPISRLRGRWHDYHGIAVMPTFHPAFLLRNEARKRDTWHDVQQIMARLGLERPGK